MCIFVNFRFILTLKTNDWQRFVIDTITLVNLHTFQNTVLFFEREVSRFDLQLPCLPILADKCDDSFVHRDCISCCPPTCTFEKQCLGSNLHCLDGCYCADGKHFVKEMMAVLMEISIQQSKNHIIMSCLRTLGLLQFSTLVGFGPQTD